MSDQNGSKFALTVRRAANLHADVWTDERIGVVARTIAPAEAGAPEVAMFLAVAARYDLDPFAKEIWMAKDKGRLIILTGKDAILKVARSHDGYLGHESDIVCAKDEFRAVHKDGEILIEHTINGFDRGALLGAYCVAKKKGHPHQLVMRKWDHFQHLHHKDNWKNYPADMLLSRVVTAAHRLLYNISGMHTPEELDSGEVEATESLASHDVAQKTRDRLEEMKAEIGGPGTKNPEPPVVEAEVVDEEPEEEKPQKKTEHDRARGRFWAVYKEAGYDTDIIEHEELRKAWLEEHFGKRSTGRLSTEELLAAAELLARGNGPRELAAANEKAEAEAQAGASESEAAEEAASAPSPGGMPF